MFFMTIDQLKKLVQEIVEDASRLCAARTSEGSAPVNYACVFAQSEIEYEELVNLARQLGPVVRETAMGPVFHTAPLETVAGNLELLKIRRPDPKRKERGDADFTVADYESFKKTYLGQPGFGIIRRPEMEMIELIDPRYNVIAYFSHPTLAAVLKIARGDE
jgi:hypothetical protein